MDKSAQLLKKTIAWVVVLISLAYIFYFFFSNPVRFQRFWDLSFKQISILLMLSIFSFIALGKQLLITLIPFTNKIRLFESFQLAITNNLLNYLPVKSGAVAKGMYLNTRYQLSLQDYILSLTAGQLIWIMLSATLGCLAAVIFIISGLEGVAFLSIWLILLVLFCAMMISYMILYFNSWLYAFLPFQKIKSFLRQYSDALERWVKHKNMLKFNLLICLTLFILFAARIWFSFQIVGQDISFQMAILLQSCVGAGFAFSFVPGNLGLKEGVIVGLALILGIDSETALLAAVIDRAASLLPTLVLGPIFLQRLTARLIDRGV